MNAILLQKEFIEQLWTQMYKQRKEKSLEILIHEGQVKFPITNDKNCAQQAPS
jgi:hypothetical protein